MASTSVPLVFPVLLFSAPWLVPIVYYLYRLRGSDDVFPSAADRLQRLWTR